jgi:hypothetical protein
MSSDCDFALIQQSVISDSHRLNLDISWIKLVTEDNYEEIKKSVSAYIPGYFEGDYDSFKKKLNSTKQYTSFSYSRDEARSTYMAYLPEAAYRAWSDCMQYKAQQANSGELIVGAHDATDNSAIITYRWEPTLNTLGSLTELEFQFAGVSNSQQIYQEMMTRHPAGSTNFSGELNFIAERNSSNSEMKIVINGKTSTGLSVNAYCTILPPPPTPQPESWEINFGASRYAEYLTPLSFRTRKLRIYVNSESTADYDEDTWQRLYITIQGNKYGPWERGTTRHNSPVLRSPSYDISVPAGTQQKIELDREDHHSSARDLVLYVQELD